MSEKKIVKPVALAVGAVLAGTFALSGAVNADTVENPFAMSALSAGYMLGTTEGSCGADKKGKAAAARKKAKVRVARRKAKALAVKALAAQTRKAKARVARRKAKVLAVKVLAVQTRKAEIPDQALPEVSLTKL